MAYRKEKTEKELRNEITGTRGEHVTSFLLARDGFSVEKLPKANPGNDLRVSHPDSPGVVSLVDSKFSTVEKGNGDDKAKWDLAKIITDIPSSGNNEFIFLGTVPQNQEDPSQPGFSSHFCEECDEIHVYCPHYYLMSRNDAMAGGQITHNYWRISAGGRNSSLNEAKIALWPVFFPEGESPFAGYRDRADFLRLPADEVPPLFPSFFWDCAKAEWAGLSIRLQRIFYPDAYITYGDPAGE
jgi:hypothetical protein